MDDFHKKEWIKNHSPANLARDTLSIDATEILMSQAYDEGFKRGQSAGRSSQQERDREDRYGPMFY